MNISLGILSNNLWEASNITLRPYVIYVVIEEKDMQLWVYPLSGNVLRILGLLQN